MGLREDEDALFRRALRQTGGWVRTVPSFEAARGLLVEHSPDVLIAPVRLGVFNGFHLAVVGRHLAPSVPAVVIVDEPDGRYENDARQANLQYLVRPLRRAEVAGLLARLARRITSKRWACRIAAHSDAFLSAGGNDAARGEVATCPPAAEHQECE